MESTYAEAQESYMDNIHLPDASLAKHNWEETLYAPLRAFVKNSIEDNTKKKDFLYIGCGPKAPVFTESNTKNSFFINSFDEICLADFSLRYLEECRETIEFKFPNKKINIRHTDITSGLSNFFFYWLSNIFIDVVNNSNLHCQLNFLNQHIVYFMDTILNGKLFNHSEKYHCAYSEMVATYTGIPAFIYCENHLKNYFNKKLITSKDLTHLRELLSNIWRQYNDKIFEFHIKDLLNQIENNGTIVIATDIEKIYNNPQKESVKSISDNTTIENIISDLSRSSPLFLKDKKLVEWDDSIRDSKNNIEYLDPHTHKVLLVSLKKNQGDNLEN